MPVKNYVSRNGQIEYEIDEAGEILTYGRDALGNVVAGYDKNTNAVFTIDYKPFGEFAATTGTITGRRFLWVGTWGYRFTPGVPVSHYIRARHLSMRMGMWTSVDPLWPSEMAYGYVECQVVTSFDYWGERKRRNNRRGTNKRGQHGRPWLSRPSKRGLTNFVPILDDLMDYYGFISECLLFAGGHLVSVGPTGQVSLRSPGDLTREEGKAICENCCLSALTLIGDKLFEPHGAAFGAGMGIIVGAPFGASVVTGAIGGFIGKEAGGALGAYLAEELADAICPALCDSIVRPCPPPFPRNPLEPVERIWPSPEGWRDILSPRLSL